MGNSMSIVKQHLYILKVSNPSLPLCPFIHTITGFNGNPISDTDPRVVFKDILSSSDLVLEVMDIRDNTTFKVCVPQGTEGLGLKVINLKVGVSLLNVRITNVRNGSCFRVNDQILGIENVYSETEEQLIGHIRNNTGTSAVMVLGRDECVVTEEVELKSDMGCEIGMGILYKPAPVDYYMSTYNKKVKRLYEACSGRDGDQAGGRDKEEKSMAGSGQQGAVSDEAAKEGGASDLDVQSGPGEECSSVQLDRLKSLGVSGAENEASPSVEPSKEGIQACGDREASDKSQAVGSSDSKTGTAARVPNETESNSNNRICSEVGLSPEAKYVQGERDLDEEGAVLINDTFAHRDDFVDDGTGPKMKEDAFNKRKRMHEDNAEPSREAQRVDLDMKKAFMEDEALNSLSHGIAAEEQADSIRSIFDDADENERLPFEMESAEHGGLNGAGRNVATPETSEGRGGELLCSQEDPVPADDQKGGDGYAEHGHSSPEHEGQAFFARSGPNQTNGQGVSDGLSGTGPSSHFAVPSIHQERTFYGSPDARPVQSLGNCPRDADLFEDEQSAPICAYEGQKAPSRGDSSVKMPILFDDVPIALYSDDNSKSLSTPAVNQSSDGFDIKDVNKSASDSEVL